MTFGASAGQIGPAALGAALAGVLVLLVGMAVHRPLARVPENGLKFIVGLMLTTFGTFWAGEGVGVEWFASDATLLGLFVIFTVASLAAVWAVRKRLRATRAFSAIAT